MRPILANSGLENEYQRTLLERLLALKHQGTEVNVVPGEELLSPVLMHVDLDRMRVVGIEDKGVLEFGELEKLRI